MLRWVLTFLLFSCIISSCEQKTQLPADIIGENEMVEIITQLEITQSYFKIKTASQDSSYSHPKFQEQHFDYLFEKHQISKDTFNNSLRYYASHPKKMENIYTKVIVSLSEQQATFR